MIDRASVNKALVLRESTAAGPGRLIYKEDDGIATLGITPDEYTYENDEVTVVLKKDYTVLRAELKGKGDTSVGLRHAVVMAILSKGAGQVLPQASALED